MEKTSRVNITLRPDTFATLAAIHELTGASRSEIVRRAVKHYAECQVELSHRLRPARGKKERTS